MVEITKTATHFIFEIKGMHKLWAFRSKIKIPIEKIVKAYQNPEELKNWKGLRAPGTYLPFVITAGTYYLCGEKIFWDVINKDNTIIVEIEKGEFNKLIIEVENPNDAINLVNDQNKE